MVDQDLITEKVGQIQNCLRRISEKTQKNPESLEDLDTQDIFVLNTQRAIQTCIDLAAHIVADEGWGMPDNLKENFSLLEKNKLLSKDLSRQLQNMVGFRNIAVHEYSMLDLEILKSILTKNLADIEAFTQVVLKHFNAS
jgi:uncharacterized protein YutE (UPF0331/DUF86 family)